MGEVLKVLVLEDVVSDAELAIGELRRNGVACESLRVETEREFRDALAEFKPDVVLSDYTLPGFNGLHALDILRAEQPEVPFIIVSGTLDEDKAIQALKGGASDYVLKGNPARLPQAVERAMRESRDRRQQRVQEQKIARLSRIHAVLSGINAAVIRIRDRQALFQEACKIAVEAGHFKMAWVGIPDSGGSKLKPVAWSGENQGYLEEVGKTIGTVSDDEGIGGQALRQKSVIVANDIATDHRVTYKEQALAHGYRSLIALPLLVEGKAVAVFLIYAADPHVFDQEELVLLGELADDVSFALAYIDKEERLNYLAYYDVLTGLPNRNLLGDRLAQAISHSKRYDSMAAVAFIDLDRFKIINDSLGHTAGDYLLKVVAERFAACLRDGDTVARLGGDEFVMVLPGQNSVEAINQVMQRIRTSIAEPVKSPKGLLATSCSIGIALYPQDGEDVETLLKHADAAMYRAKELGRNTFQFFTGEMNDKINDRLLMETRLRNAVQNGEMHLDYQPLVDQRAGGIIGVEALARWDNPEAGTVLPEVFIPLAEETDLILAIGEWVLRQACAQNKAWQEVGLRPVPVSVNVSARQFRQLDLPELVARVLAETGLEARWLNLELTESVIMQNTAAAAEIMRELRSMGVSLSIDDFGTGFSSLAYLRRFPVSRLKIDRAFVGDIVAGGGDAAIAQAVVSLGHSLGLKVVAEGVETPEQAAFLAARDCDEAQGFYYSVPLSAEDFGRVLKEGLKKS